jgi:hypothetical protein
MSKQTINLGTGSNSGTGDGIRTAFTKVNSNFTELYNSVAAIPAAQVPSDWNATSGLSQILNKPTIPAAYTLPTASTTVLGGVKVDGTTVTINGSGVISAEAVANTLSGTTLASNITLSSLTAVGVLTNLSVTNPIAGSVTGNAGTVTNGVYTNGSYSNPSWLTSLSYSKLLSAPALATVATTGAYADITGKPATFTPPFATTAAIGGVRVDGTTITVDVTGLIAAPASGHNHNATGLLGTTLATGVVNSSLTTVGTLTSLNVSGPTVITNGIFRLPGFTTTQRNTLTPTNGDTIYNSTVNKFQGYQNGGWINLDTGAAA